MRDIRSSDGGRAGGFQGDTKVLVPATKAALAGKVAFTSLDVIATVLFVLITFQLASTALTVTPKALPAVWEVGVPVLPEAVPAAGFRPASATAFS